MFVQLASDKRMESCSPPDAPQVSAIGMSSHNEYDLSGGRSMTDQAGNGHMENWGSVTSPFQTSNHATVAQCTSSVVQQYCITDRVA